MLGSMAAILVLVTVLPAIKSSGKELEEKRALKCGVCENLAVISLVLLRLLLRVFVRASLVGQQPALEVALYGQGHMANIFFFV